MESSALEIHSLTSDEAKTPIPLILQGLSQLPPFHPSAAQLLSVPDEGAISRFEAVFESDPALTADLIKYANSPLFGFRTRVDTIRHGITLLGLDRVRNLAVTLTMNSSLQRFPPAQQAQSIWSHGLATAVIAEMAGKFSCGFAGMYTAGLLHDLGRLGLLLLAPASYEPVLTGEFGDLGAANAEEERLFGINHLAAGSLLADSWRFPLTLRTCIANHHGMVAEKGSPEWLIHHSCQLAGRIGFPEVRCKDPGDHPEDLTDFPSDPAFAPERLRLVVEQHMSAIREIAE